MAQRRTMYRGDRRRKEDQRKAKQEAKRARKAERRESGKGGPEIGEAASLQGSATEFVWFSPSKGRTLTTFLGAALGIAFAVRNRALLYAPVRARSRAWVAALAGGLGCGVMGAVTNDSGPLLLTNAVISLAAVTAYVQGCPDLGGGASDVA